MKYEEFIKYLTNGYLDDIGIDTKIIKPYIDWKLGKTVRMSKKDIYTVFDYLYDIVNQTDIADNDQYGIVYDIDDEVCELKLMCANGIIESANTNKIMYRANKPECIAINDVLFNEIYELNNVDILEYCIYNYNLSDALKEEIDNLVDAIDTDDYISEDYIRNIIDDLINELCSLTGKNLKYVLWLTFKNVAIDFYNDGNTDNIYKYDTSDIILSDLGEDGILFAYENIPGIINENKNNVNKKALYESIIKNIAKQVKKALNESDVIFDDEDDEEYSDEVIELANYLKCEPEELEKISNNNYKWGDEEYLIFEDEDDARYAAYESLQNLIDDIGVGEAFDKNLVEDFIDENELERFQREDAENYCDDIETEKSDLTYDNLLEEILTEGEFEDEDEYINSLNETELENELIYYECETTEEYLDKLRNLPSEKKMSRLREEMLNNSCQTKEEYIDKLCEDDAIEWFKDNFGEKELYKYAIENNCIDIDELINNVLNSDGYGDVLASYDGKECITDNNWLVYRTN